VGAPRSRAAAAGSVLSDAGAGARRPLLHGRRRGRKLRPGQRRLLDTLLPRLRFALPCERPLDPRRLFDRPVEAVWLEIGFGAGEHLAAQAGQERAIGFIGCEAWASPICAC